MKIDLTPTEVSLLLYFMETLGDKYSVAGCNDLKVYNSQDMLEIISQSFEDEEDEKIMEEDTARESASRICG